MHLFSPLTIGRARVPNRIAMSAMPSGHVTADGFASSALRTYYGERAQGGAGLLVLESACALPPAGASPHLGLYDDAYITDLRQCISAIHAPGSVALITIDQPLPVAQMSAAELGALGAAWVSAAWRARAAGADGIMLSCADGGPLDALLSPLTNQRADQHGGDMNARMRLLLEIVEQVTAWMGPRLVIGIKLNIGEFTTGGLTLQDTRVIANRLVGAGVKLLEISANADGDTPIARFPGWRVPLAAAIKAVVEVPVMVGGLLADAELADSVIRDGSADLVALAESLRAEPRWPQYARGVLDEE